jgi:hypothetical protein
MINLNDDKQTGELFMHALDVNVDSAKLMGAAVGFLATLACRVNKETGGSIDDIVDFSCRKIKHAANEILNVKKGVH